MEGYRVPEHVYLCRTREGVLFLNLRTDQYLGVSGQDLAHLAAVVPGWPVGPARRDSPELSERATQMARKLQHAGLLTTDLIRGKSADPPVLEHATSSLLSQLSCSRSRAVPFLLARLAYSALKVAVILKFCSLEYAVLRVRQRKRARGPCNESGNKSGVDPAIAALTSDFLRLRPLVYSSQGKCLYDCLVILEFLSHSRLFPKLVIGVATFPFNAHGWLQQGPLILTDSVERTRDYTPILVI